MGGRAKFNVALFFEIVQKFSAECLGTTILVMVGCMGHNIIGGDRESVIGASIAFSLAVFAGVQIASHVSGGHVNPAVTVLSLFFKKLNWYMAIVYICGQVFGGILGFGLVLILIPKDLRPEGLDNNRMCITAPTVELSLPQAFFIELLLTSVLMLVICTFWDSRSTGSETLSIKIGLTVTTLTYAGSHLTGCSLNPARSFGPALWNGQWNELWIYMFAPVLAAGVCGSVYKLLFDPTSFRKKKESDES